mgnify:CR=1 FL=1
MQSTELIAGGAVLSSARRGYTTDADIHGVHSTTT